MKVAEIRNETELQALQNAWNQLVCESASRTIFLTWEWVSAWWSAYGTPGELRVLTFSDDAGVLRGIAPLRIQTIRKYRQHLTALSFIGDGSNDSDYLDLIAAPGYEQPVMEALHGYCAEMFESGGVLLLNETPETSPLFALVRDSAESRGMFWKATDVPCATVPLPQDWDNYLRMLQPRFRTKVRSVLRHLESRPEIRFQFCTDTRELDRLLPVLFDLHTRRWATEGKPGVFGWDRKRDFYLRLSHLLLERRWLRLSWLEWNGQVLACQYGFAYGGTYFQLQEGYEPACEHWNVGIGLRAWSVREFIRQGLREYDFLGGVGKHKTSWGAAIKHSKRIVLAAKSPKNLMFRHAPEWETAGREWARKLLPDSVLAARQARLQAAPTWNGKSGIPRVRHAAAACYFHSGLSAFTRRLRDRYQLSIQENGIWPKISWKKRREPSARIFYYHRVNNENDPFFHALPTDVFEQQIRYVARHYKVLGMSGLIRHLEEAESTEPAIAITFDDGYEDNFRNAFPILKRYGLPATIFLTTGSIDSGEPLWFDRLAEGIQGTARESLELEIDIPRRFPLRTQAERLEAHQRIFSILRRLTDAERRKWFAEILRELGEPGSAAGERRQRMLSWDQIREMVAHGIEFGGHTVTHPFLSKLTRREACWEVSECKRRIEEELQRTAEYFAYPNGRQEDFAAFNKELLRAAGYRAAMTTIWGINDRSTDRMELRRGGPWENNPALFAYKLDWYQWVNQ